MEPFVVLLAEDGSRSTPLVQALEARGVAVEVWNPRTVVLDVSQKPICENIVYVNRVSSACTARVQQEPGASVAMPAGPAEGCARALIAWLCAHSAPLLNGPRVMDTELSKTAQMALLSAHGVPTPRTWLLHAAATAPYVASAAGVPSGDPVALKPDAGGGGHGVLGCPHQAGLTVALTGGPTQAGGGGTVDVTSPSVWKRGAASATPRPDAALVHACAQACVEQFGDAAPPALHPTQVTRNNTAAKLRRYRVATGDSAPPVTWASGAPWVMQEWVGDFPMAAGDLKTTYHAEFVDGRLLYILRARVLASATEVCPCDSAAVAQAKQMTMTGLAPEDLPPAAAAAWPSVQDGILAALRSIGALAASVEFRLPTASGASAALQVYDVNFAPTYRRGLRMQRGGEAECGWEATAAAVVRRVRTGGAAEAAHA